MRKPEFRNLQREDFPDAPWIEKLLRPLNLVLGQVASGLGNGLTLGENLNAEVKTLDIATRDEWVNVTLGAKFAAWGNAGFYQGVQYRRVGGDVELRGLVNPSAGVTGSDLIATLPVDARPAKDRIFNLASPTAGMHLTVRPTGDIGTNDGAAPVAGAWISLDGIRFEGANRPAGNGGFPVRFKTKVSGKLAGVIVLRCVEIAGRDERNVAAAIGAPGWAQDGSSVTLNSVSGLTGGRTYRLTLAVIGG